MKKGSEVAGLMAPCLYIQIELKATDAFLPGGARVNTCSHDAEVECRLSVAPFHRALALKAPLSSSPLCYLISSHSAPLVDFHPSLRLV